MLIWADETALPAATAALEWPGKPICGRGSGWRSRTPGTARPIDTRAAARISWLVRDEDAPDAVEAVRAAELPEETRTSGSRARRPRYGHCDATWCVSAASTASG